MRFLIMTLILTAVAAAGCSAIKGERFWWNDQKQTKLDNNYELPEWPAETPLSPGETPYVDKKFHSDEVERARRQEQKQIAAGIPRCGVADPLANPVKVKVAQWNAAPAETEADAAAPAAK